MHDDDSPLIGEDDRADWIEDLTVSKRDVYPPFKAAGFTFPEFYIVLMLNRLRTELMCVRNGDPDDEWGDDG